MSNGVNACAQCVRGVGQSSPSLFTGIVSGKLDLLKRVVVQSLTLESAYRKTFSVIGSLLLKRCLTRMALTIDNRKAPVNRVRHDTHK